MYSPISFGRKYDKNGDFIRHFVPELKDFPAKYIYEPWTAPLDTQRQAQCIIGIDYPKPIVDHKEAMAENKARLQQAYADGKGATPKTAAPVLGGARASGGGDGERGAQRQSLLTDALQRSQKSPTRKRKSVSRSVADEHVDGGSGARRHK